jgi:predicted dehydrogenase
MARLAFLGGAHIHTPNFVRTLSTRTDHRVEVVWDHEGERARRVAESLGARTTDDVEQALRDVDAVVICSETVHHARLVDAACAAGKALFVEKPLGMRAEDAERMAARIERAGVLFQTGFFMRGNPVHRYLRDEIRNGTFGRITHVRHSNCHAGALQGWFDKEWRWMADPAQAGVGAFGDLGAHSVDLLVWLLGPVARVACTIRDVTRRYGDCDELGEAVLEFENGAIGSVVAGWVDVANPVTLHVSGTEGLAYVSAGQLFVHCKRLAADGKSAWTALPPALPHAFDQFLDALGGAAAELVGAREAAYGGRVIDAMYRAAREQRWVNV